MRNKYAAYLRGSDVVIINTIEKIVFEEFSLNDIIDESGIGYDSKSTNWVRGLVVNSDLSTDPEEDGGDTFLDIFIHLTKENYS